MCRGRDVSSTERPTDREQESIHLYHASQSSAACPETQIDTYPADFFVTHQLTKYLRLHILQAQLISPAT